MTRDSEEVPVEPLTARGGVRLSSQGTGNSMTESKLDEPTKQKAAIQGETIANQHPRQQEPATPAQSPRSQGQECAT